MFDSSHGQNARSGNKPEQANEKAESRGRFEERSPALSGANGALAEEIAERKRAESRRTISLCQDGG